MHLPPALADRAPRRSHADVRRASARAVRRSWHARVLYQGVRWFSEPGPAESRESVAPQIEAIAVWTHVLTGIEPERVERAREEVRGWGYAHVSDELLDDTVDAAVAATLLVEGVEKIGEHGVARQRLLKKLRKNQDVWGTWAEIRAADILLRTIGRDSTLHLEEGRSRGAHADLRFLPANLEVGQSVEVKAIGLSDREVDFCQRMAPALRRLLPPVGLSHGHASLDARAPVVTRDVRREGARQGKQAIKALPRYPRGLRGAVVVEHGSEGDYARRVGRRVAQAVRQLPQGDECWVAIYWSNGAPMAAVGAAVPWAEIPSRVQGLIFVGCGVTFPDRQIHCYTSVLGRNAEVAEAMPIHSLMDHGGVSDFGP